MEARPLEPDCCRVPPSLVSGLHQATQHYRRATSLPEANELALREALTECYKDLRVESAVLEKRLEAYYESDLPRELFHQVIDILTVRYFCALFGPTSEYVPYKDNEPHGDVKHSGLTREQLEDSAVTYGTYQAVLRRLCRELLTDGVRSLTGGDRFQRLRNIFARGLHQPSPATTDTART